MDEIPEAIFVENVPRYLKRNFKSALSSSGEITEACAHEALVSFDQRVNQYRKVQLSSAQKKKQLEKRLPDLKLNLESIKLLIQNGEPDLKTKFQLCESVYTEAQIDSPKKVIMAIGANIFLEYDVKEAESELTKTKTNLTNRVQTLQEELDFVNQQIDICEMSKARIVSWLNSKGLIYR